MATSKKIKKKSWYSNMLPKYFNLVDYEQNRYRGLCQLYSILRKMTIKSEDKRLWTMRAEIEKQTAQN